MSEEKSKATGNMLLVVQFNVVASLLPSFITRYGVASSSLRSLPGLTSAALYQETYENSSKGRRRQFPLPPSLRTTSDDTAERLDTPRITQPGGLKNLVHIDLRRKSITQCPVLHQGNISNAPPVPITFVLPKPDQIVQEVQIIMAADVEGGEEMEIVERTERPGLNLS